MLSRMMVFLLTLIRIVLINRVENTKCLGVIIHQNLSWQAHSIKAISSKIAKSTGIIIKSRQFFLSNTLCTLYNSLILPYLQYCSIIWASTYSSHLQPFFFLQKNALRIITHSPPRAYTYSLFNKFKILNIFISTKFLALFSFTWRSSCPLLFHLFSFVTLIVINISPGKKTIYIFILTNILFLFWYRVLKFGITFLSHFVIHLLFSPHVRESKTLLDSGFHAVDSGFQLVDSRSFSVEL